MFQQLFLNYFLQIIVFCFLGVVVGILCGLLPGLHPNLVSVLLISYAGLIPLPTPAIVSFIVSVSVVNSVVNFIPAILLGVPDAGNEMSLLPGHRMLMKGLGHEAVKLCVFGAFWGLMLCLAVLPLLVWGAPLLYNVIKPHLHIVLGLVVFWMILKDKKHIGAIVLFIMSGVLGLMANILPIPSGLILFPLLTGLFGMSMIILSIRQRVHLPDQKGELFVSDLTKRIGVVKGSIGGLITGLLPGVGASEAALLTSFDNEPGFLTSIGAITMTNTVFSFLMLWLIGKGRSGAAVALDYFTDIGMSQGLLILSVSGVACSVAVVATLWLTKKCIKIMNKVNYEYVNICVLCLLLVLIFALTGFYGLLLSIVSTLVGLIPNLTGIRRMHLMACLILPSILFFVGVL